MQATCGKELIGMNLLFFNLEPKKLYDKFSWPKTLDLSIVL